MQFVEERKTGLKSELRSPAFRRKRSVQIGEDSCFTLCVAVGELVPHREVIDLLKVARNAPRLSSSGQTRSSAGTGSLGDAIGP